MKGKCECTGNQLRKGGTVQGHTQTEKMNAYIQVKSSEKLKEDKKHLTYTRHVIK